MTHPRAEQLRFARSEFQRGLVGLTDEDARKRLLPMNSITWMIGHMAWHERLVWFVRGQGLEVEPILDPLASGQPATTPPLDEMLAVWGRVTAAADPFIDSLTTGALEVPLPFDKREPPSVAGSQLQRVTYHYWDHIGEASAVRQILGHPDLPQYIGDLDGLAPYRRET
jgi:DinB superfamily